MQSEFIKEVLHGREQAGTTKDIFGYFERYFDTENGRKIVEFGSDPKNYHSLDSANGYASCTGTCGDTMQILVKIYDKIIADIGFRTDGCDSTRAAGSVLTELSKGLTMQQAREITPSQIDMALDGLPEDHKHCVVLTRETLHKAIDNYFKSDMNPSVKDRC